MRLGRRAVVAAALALATPVAAAPYEAFIDVESQEDLDDLLAIGEITSETHAALTEILARGVDLDRATRDELYSLPNLTYDEVDAILAYRDTQRFVADPADLVAAGALSEQKLLAIAAFLVTRDRSRSEYQPHGWVRSQVRAAQGDRTVPPIAVRARATFGRNLTAGAVATLTRQGVANPAWDDNRDGLLVDDAGVRPRLPKGFVRYRGDHFDLIAGTYRIGFGERVTFDNSADYTPNGIYLDDQVSYSPELTRTCREVSGELGATPCPESAGDEVAYESRDYKTSDGLLGVAAGSDHLALGQGYVQAYGWGSYQPRGLYQYQLADRGVCTDPDGACSAPPAFVRPSGDVLAPAAGVAYQTLPNLWSEALVGGHVAYHVARRDFVGVTAYGATTRWLIDVPEDVKLDFQDWAATPIGGRYGAVGLSAGVSRGIYDANLEVTRSFDREPNVSGELSGGGGVGAVLRLVRAVRKRELELTARYYDVDFNNPHAGPLAASEQVDGMRARGEHGARVRYAGVHGRLTVRAAIDAWRAYVRELDVRPPGAPAPEPWVPRLSAFVHTDLTASDQIGYGLWIDFTDKDLRDAGYGECYETAVEIDREQDQAVPCQGMRLKTTARLRVTPNRDLVVRAQVQHAWQDDTSYPDSRRSDLGAAVQATWRASKQTRVRGRIKYLSEDVADNRHLEQSLAAYGEWVQRLRGRDSLTVRVDTVVWLDKRASTLQRTPSPELRLLLGYVAKF